MPKRILFVVPSLRGGAGIAVEEIINTVISIDGGREFSVSRLVLDDLEAGWNPLPNWWTLVKGSVNRLLWKPVNFILARAGLPRISWPVLDTGFGKLIDEGGFDLVFLGWLGEGSLSIREIQALITPFCYRYSDLWPVSGLSHYDQPTLKRSNKLLLSAVSTLEERLLVAKQRALSRARLAISPSFWVAERHKTVFGELAPPIRVIPNLLKHAPLQRSGEYGREPNKSSRAGEALRLCFVAPGRLLDQRKGGQWLRRLIGELDSQLAARGTGIPVRFTIIGRGNFRSRYKAVRITHLANQPRDQIQLELNDSDILIFLSWQDNSPNIALEAMSQSCLILGFESSGILEIVGDDLAEWLSPFGDFAGVVANILYFLQCEIELEALKAEAASMVTRRNSREALGGLYVKTLREALT